MDDEKVQEVQTAAQESLEVQLLQATHPCIESFHSIIKKELIYLNKYETRAEAEKSIFEYIEVFYNNERIHSSIGYSTQTNFERQYYLITLND